MKLNKKIETERKKLRLSRREISEELKIPESKFTNWEQNKSTPKLGSTTVGGSSASGSGPRSAEAASTENLREVEDIPKHEGELEERPRIKVSTSGSQAGDTWTMFDLTRTLQRLRTGTEAIISQELHVYFIFVSGTLRSVICRTYYEKATLRRMSLH